jgi:RimJ/RimL family protein N-acetyltransferase
MSTDFNEYGQPVGALLPEWTPRPRPPLTSLQGRFCRLEILDIARHAPDLHAAYGLDPDGRHWSYLPFGPFAKLEDYAAFLRARTADGSFVYHIVVDPVTGRAIGTVALFRADLANGVIEIGNIRYSSLLQRTPAATEAVYLVLRRVFDELHYRRCEWKCDSHNVNSRRAAERYGFTFEGTFRNAAVQRGRSRDSHWLSIIDSDWRAIRRGYEAWLAPENFDGEGKQLLKLAEMIRGVRGPVQSDTG